jgi:hypothetical protein
MTSLRKGRAARFQSIATAESGFSAWWEAGTVGNWLGAEREEPLARHGMTSQETGPGIRTYLFRRYAPKPGL